MKLNMFLFIVIFIPFITLAQQMLNGLNVNEKAPVFSAKDQFGNLFNLVEQLKKGPIVMVFYRGEWCPYCNRQLKGLQDSLPFIIQKGANLVAVSPEQHTSILKTVKKTNASYPILFDDELKIMKSYHVAFKVDEVTIERYKNFGIDFNAVNGSNGATLPVPTVYIISKDGTITFKHYDPDYKKRISVKEILANL